MGDGRAAWRQLADQLRDRITTGELPPGARIPSEERINQETGLSRNTIRRALHQLRAEGLVTVDPPHPTRVRVPPEQHEVVLAAGAVVRARMPTPAERAEHDVPEGVPVLDVSGALYPADRVVLRVPDHTR